MNEIKLFLTSARVQNTLRAAVRVLLFTFLGLFLPGIFGWLHDLTEWARNSGQTPFPDFTSLAYLGVTAIASAFSAVVTIAIRAVENATGKGILRDVPFAKDLEEIQDAEKRAA